MDLRVTLQTQVNQSLYHERQQTDALARLEEQASTGNRILAPEDDPLGAVAVINYTAQDANYNTDLTNINTATTNLNVGVSTLQDASNIIVSASSLAIQGTNGVNDQTALSAIGDQVNSLLQRFTDVANTQNNGRFIFGGTRSAAPPFTTDAAGNVTYVGGSQRASIPVSGAHSVDTYYVGSTLFQAPQTSAGGNNDAFQVLTALRDDLRNTRGLSAGDQLRAISSHIGDLSQIKDNILAVAGEQSASLQNLSGLQNHVQDVQLQTKKLAGDLQSADIASVVTNLQAQQNLFQATLATTAKVFSQSLLDFIK